MITLIIEENNISKDDEEISDFSAFLKALPPETELTLILKTPDVLYHLCPVRQAVTHLKSAEFSLDHWVGERLLPENKTLVVGILPSFFMRQTIQCLGEHSFAIKAIFLWTDLIVRSYGPLPDGWAVIWHDPYLLICQEGILCVSRLCHSPLVQELPAIARYLKRFGYQEGVSLTLLSSSEISHELPSFVRFEKRKATPFPDEGVRFLIPDLKHLLRLYKTPRIIHRVVYGFVVLTLLGSGYLTWEVKGTVNACSLLKQRINEAPPQKDVDERKIQAFTVYRQLIAQRSSPLPLLGQLIPVMRGEAVVTYLHWTASPFRLSLRLEVASSQGKERLLSNLRAHLVHHRLDWQESKEEPLKGVLTIESS